MHILINGKQIGVNEKPTVKRSNMDGHLTFNAVIPRENLTATEIDELREYIKENAPVIEFYDDNGEKVQTFEGFSLYPLYSPNREGTAWNLTIENESELKYQYGLLKDRATALENQNFELLEVVTKQNKTITTLEFQNTELNETVNALLGLEG